MDIGHSKIQERSLRRKQQQHQYPCCLCRNKSDMFGKCYQGNLTNILYVQAVVTHFLYYFTI